MTFGPCNAWPTVGLMAQSGMIRQRSIPVSCLTQSWRAWVTKELHELEGVDNFEKVEEWSREGEVESDLASVVDCEPNANLVRALTTYYRFKRIEFQADYFKRRRETYERKTDRWRHLNLPIFFVSVFCVIAHFALEFLANHLARTGDEAAAVHCESLGVWFVARGHHSDSGCRRARVVCGFRTAAQRESLRRQTPCVGPPGQSSQGRLRQGVGRSITWPRSNTFSRTSTANGCGCCWIRNGFYGWKDIARSGGRI
jgi:hypothetical protein